MNRRNDHAGPLFSTDSKEGVRSRAYLTTDEGFVAGKGTSEGAAVFINSPGKTMPAIAHRYKPALENLMVALVAGLAVAMLHGYCMYRRVVASNGKNETFHVI